MVSDMTAYTLHRTAYKAQGHASQVAGNFHNGRNKIKKSEDILKIQGKPFEHPSAFVHIISLVRCKMSTVSQKGISKNIKYARFIKKHMLML